MITKAKIKREYWNSFRKFIFHKKKKNNKILQKLNRSPNVKLLHDTLELGFLSREMCNLHI